MIKAIATDLDGTLFYPQTKTKLIHYQNVECIKHFLNNGKELILVTGRNHSIAKKVEKAIGMESSLSLVGCNGAIVVHKGEVIKETPIENSTISDLYDDFINDPYCKIVFVMGSFDGMFVSPVHISKTLWNIGKIGFRLQGAYYEKTHYGGKKKLINLIENENNKIYKIMPVYALGNKSKKGCDRAYEALLRLKEKFGDKFEFATSTTALEITAKGVTKGSSLSMLLQTTGIEKNEVAVVGDSGNDIAMFNEFEESYAMKHSPKFVRKKAKHEIFFWYELKKHID